MNITNAKYVDSNKAGIMTALMQPLTVFLCTFLFPLTTATTELFLSGWLKATIQDAD